MIAWIWFSLALIVAGFIWHLQRRWEIEHPGQRNWYFSWEGK